MSSSDLQLPFDEVKASNFFCNTVLDLEACVHFHEVEFVSVSVKDEFNSTCVSVTNSLSSSDSGSSHLFSQSFTNVRRSFFDNFLMAALNRAVSLVHMDVITMLITENLELYVSRVSNEFLNNHMVVAESSHSFSLSSF